MPVTVELFTDPTCPWAYSAEPARQRLRRVYGDQLEIRPRMIVLAEDTTELTARGFTTELLAGAVARVQALHGMPIDTAPRPRLVASVAACRAVVAARLHAPEAEDALLRRLRIAAMGGALVDEPEVLARVATEAGVDADALAGWTEDPAVEAAMREDMRAARSPGPAALALDHKLAPAGDGRRYTAPSYVFHGADGRVLEAPGFQPSAVYEALLANLAPELERHPLPESVEDALRWADEPLATAEVAALLDLDQDEVRTRLAGVAEPQPVGLDAFWALTPASAAA
jgi:predicted DsbA family dithiol-disulfide isomerase